MNIILDLNESILEVAKDKAAHMEVAMDITIVKEDATWKRFTS